MKTLLFAFYLLISFAASSQQNMETWVEARMKAGFLVAHRSSMGHLATDHAYAGELSLIFQPNNQRNWHKAYRNPIYGFTFFGGSVGSNEVLGNYYGLYPFISFPFIKQSFYTFSGKMGAGIGYGANVYDQTDNITNLAMSTHINAQIVLALESRFVFGNHSMTINLDMTHFSNGAAKVPNLGINIPYVSMGYGYKIKNASEELDTFVDRETPRIEFGVMGIGSVQEMYPTNGRKYPFYGLNFLGRKYFSPKSGMEVSFDIFSKQSILDYHNDVEKTQLDILQLGFYTGYLIPLDKLHIIVGMGYYVRDKYKPADWMYHRLGLRYVMDNGLNFNLTLKSHWARADYVEYGIGYTFNR